MDDKLVPLMVLLSAVLLVAMLISGFAFWRRRRNVARNVVHAALTQRQLDAAQRAEVDRVALELLAGLRVRADAFASQPPVVHFALKAMAMRRLGILPAGLPRPFSALDSPYLARSVQQHIRVVRFHAENAHGVTLSELDAPAPAPEAPR